MTDEEELIATISGPALSMLLYENARIHDQIGFLLGEVVVYVTKQVTDSDRDVENVKQHINIKNVVAFPIGPPFYDSIGQVNKETLIKFLGDSVNKVVGWYHYREDYRLIASVRDEVMHHQLSAFFDQTTKLVSHENFIFCLLTTSASNNNGTHKFKQLFQRRKDGKFHPVSLKINNLGADASRPDGSDYKPVPQLSSCDSDAFQEVYKRIRKDLQRTSGVESVTLIQKAAEHLLDQIIPKVTETDRLVAEREQRLFKLRNEYFRKLFEKSELADRMSKMEVDDDETRATDRDELQVPSSPEMFDSPKNDGCATKPTKETKSSEVDFFAEDQAKTSVKEESSNSLRKTESTRSTTLPATSSRNFRKTRNDSKNLPTGTGRGAREHS